jgi:hypothetical protein
MIFYLIKTCKKVRETYHYIFTFTKIIFWVKYRELAKNEILSLSEPLLIVTLHQKNADYYSVAN